jgi:hypothetical protein
MLLQSKINKHKRSNFLYNNRDYSNKIQFLLYNKQFSINFLFANLKKFILKRQEIHYNILYILLHLLVFETITENVKNFNTHSVETSYML